jgi:hypothetical protein
MRWFIALVLAAGQVAATAAEEKHAALTPDEIAAGAILLFDGETTFGWTVEGKANVSDGVLILGRGDKPTVLTTTCAFGRAEVRWAFRQGGNKAATMLWRGESRRVSSSAEFVRETYEPAAAAISPIVLTVPAGTELEIREFSLLPKELKPLFNGKDLADWKQFAGDARRERSKFTVTADGWLHLKNGPGDLQTQRQFDDFILQIECRSNGKHLNSGVFFRCLPGQYQQGYEAQIQNGYKDGDRSKPVDFGTGAIYRRQPARRVVSNDHEWFTMTVLAHGKHMATWVNGYQVTDFTDERPPSDNARNGSKTGAGAISLQGHDPTTDLDFRNIRIAELK